MPPNIAPIFTLTPVIGAGLLSSANTNRDGTGDLVSILTGSANGTRVTRIRIISTGGTVTAGMVRIFITLPGSGTYLYDECAISAVTPSGSEPGFDSTFEYIGEKALILPANAILKASTHNAETFVVWAEGGDY